MKGQAVISTRDFYFAVTFSPGFFCVHALLICFFLQALGVRIFRGTARDSAVRVLIVVIIIYHDYYYYYDYSS